MEFTKSKAFSLIEIMVGLIVVSIMVAAFSPVITKKVSNTSVALSQQDSLNGMSIKSKLFNYSDALNGVGGCTIVNGGTYDGTYLKCPFEIPEGVSKVGFVLVSGGGGGGGASDHQTFSDSRTVQNGNVTTITITKNMRNVKVPVMVSGGGGGGGGAHYFEPHVPKRPTKSSDCDPNGGKNKLRFHGFYYRGNNPPYDSSCISPATFQDHYQAYRDILHNYSINKIERVIANDYVITPTKWDDKNETIGKINRHYGGTDKICYKKFGYLQTNNSSTPTYNNKTMVALLHYSTSNTPIDNDDINSPYFICNYPAALYICNNYKQGGHYNNEVSDKGRWRIVTPNEVKFLQHHDYNYYDRSIKAYIFTHSNDSGYNKPPTYTPCIPPDKKVSAIANLQYSYAYSNKFYLKIMKYHNPCLPMYMWTNDGNYSPYFLGYENKNWPTEFVYLRKPDPEQFPKRIKNYSYREVIGPNEISELTTPELIRSLPIDHWNIFRNYSNYPSELYMGGNIQLVEENKQYAAMQVRCAIDDINPIYSYFDIASGGGGDSGQYVGNITIPQNVISANVGGKIEIKAGSKGVGGTKSGDGTNKNNGNRGTNGGTSYIYVKNKSGGTVWAIEIHGGSSGNPGMHTNVSGGATNYFYKYYNGTSWQNKTSADSGIGVGSYKKGYIGPNGLWEQHEYFKDDDTATITKNGGAGGAAIYNGSYGAGGKGGDAYGDVNGTSADNGSDGTGGIVTLTWDDVRIGGPGSGGGGGNLLKMQDIQVNEGQKFYVKVGKGGAGGVNGNGSKGGVSAFGNYWMRGGYGGKKGINQTATANPKSGSSGYADNNGTSGGVLNKKGRNGGIGSVNASNLYGTGGIGGDSGINVYLRDLGKTYADLSVGCGGYSHNPDKNCYNSSNINPKFSGDAFLNPGKIHRSDSIKYGSAGSGGGGGGVNPDTLQNAKGLNGQDGYVYVWWEEPD